MDRRRFLLIYLAGDRALPRKVAAQSGRIWRIGYLSLVSGTLERYRPWTTAFRDGLRQLGYVLMSYRTEFVELFRRGATLAEKILKGAKPADLPVEQPAKFELILNLRTAKALGITIPPSLLLRADQVIE
jgi:putative tryptophan/tyrosine transport system substrate-binding protein